MCRTYTPLSSFLGRSLGRLQNPQGPPAVGISWNLRPPYPIAQREAKKPGEDDADVASMDIRIRPFPTALLCMQQPQHRHGYPKPPAPVQRRNVSASSVAFRRLCVIVANSPTRVPHGLQNPWGHCPRQRCRSHLSCAPQRLPEAIKGRYVRLAFQTRSSSRYPTGCNGTSWTQLRYTNQLFSQYAIPIDPRSIWICSS